MTKQEAEKIIYDYFRNRGWNNSSLFFNYDDAIRMNISYFTGFSQTHPNLEVVRNMDIDTFKKYLLEHIKYLQEKYNFNDKVIFY